MVESNRVAQVGDNCDVTWACPAADTGFTVDRQNRVWRRYVDVLTPDVGKIDHVVRLDRQYTLTRLGLSLRNGRVASGRVYASTDGVAWGTAIATFTDRTHLSIEYVPVAATARFVKVEVDPSATCDAGLGTGCTMLNELEMYSGLWTATTSRCGPTAASRGGPARGWRSPVQERCRSAAGARSRCRPRPRRPRSLVDGQPVATGVPPSTASATLVGYSFASGGTGPVGDVIVVDDVSFA